jgi:hypothetical protein
MPLGAGYDLAMDDRTISPSRGPAAESAPQASAKPYVNNRRTSVLQRAEELLRPRLTALLSWTGERIIGVALLVLTVVLALPIPFGNWLHAFAICIIGLAMVEKDGLAVLVGFAVGAFSLVVAGTVVIGLLHAFFLLLSSLAG